MTGLRIFCLMGRVGTARPVIAMSRNSFHQVSDFTEDTVALMIQVYLSLLTFPSLNFSIELFSRKAEHWLGADAKLLGRMRGFSPFYMQFKRPEAYRDQSLSRVIHDRKRLKLTVAPRALFFPLRDKLPAHPDYQHNALYWLNQYLQAGRLGAAAYVCPLFLDRTSYLLHMHVTGLRHWWRFWMGHPYDTHDVLIADGGKTIRFSDIPLLAEHVCIPPHAPVTSARHRYSFTEQGSEVCFHSPEQLPQTGMSLAAWLKDLYREFASDDRLVRPENAFDHLKRLLKKDTARLQFPDELFQGQDGIAAWLAWGDYLRHEYDIEQFAFVRWEREAAAG